MRAATAYEKLKPLPHARLVALLSDKDRMVRDAARYHLVCRDTKAVQRDALKLCRSEQRLLREYGALILGELTLSESAIVEQVLTLLCQMAVSDSGACVRAGAFFALAHRCNRGGDRSAVLKAVMTGYKDRSCSVRYAVAVVLAYINLPGAETALLSLLGDKDKDVRDWAAFAVYMHEDEAKTVFDTSEIRDALLALTVDPFDDVRYEAFRALGVLREKRAAPALQRELLTNEEEVFYDLVIAAERLNDPSLIPVLEKLLERFEDGEGIMKNALARLQDRSDRV